MVTVFDLLVLFPLEMDAFPFAGLVSLLNAEEFRARDWFPTADFSGEQVLFSLRRLLSAGMVTCHADSEISSPPLPQPVPSMMREYWYDLAARGSATIQLRAPWYYDVSSWLLPPAEGELGKIVQHLRDKPLQWYCDHASARPAPSRGLRAWESHHMSLRGVAGVALSAHFLDRLRGGLPELHSGHFRPSTDDNAISLEARQPLKPQNLSNVDRMILDVLLDDVESVWSILGILNHDEAPYRRWHFGQPFLEEEVFASLVRLESGGYVVGYYEAADPVVRLQPLESSDSVGPSGLWFALTDAGRKAASEPWQWEED